MTPEGTPVRFLVDSNERDVVSDTTTLRTVAEDVVVAAIAARFGFDDEILAGQCVYEHVDPTGTGHHCS